MAHVFQTTIDPEAGKVLVIAPSSVFTTQLVAALTTLHLTPEVIRPENVREDQVRAGYMCLLVDIPVFGDQEQKKRAYGHALSVLQHTGRIPVLLITFDASKSRKTGVSPRDPTSATRWIVSTALQTLQHLRHVDYLHVLYPYEAGYSTVARFILEKITGGDAREIVGECQPLWYSDVIEHIVTLLYDPAIPAGIFSGRERIPIAKLETDVRLASSQKTHTTSSVDFPYVFSSSAQQIGRVGYQTMLQEFSLIVPPPHQEPFADTPLKNPVLVPKKIKKQPFLSMKSIGAAVASVFFVYVLVVGIFLSTFFQTRTLLQEYVISEETLLSSTQSRKLDHNLTLLREFIRFVPFPYATIGQTLATDRILSGIEGMRELVRMGSSFSEKRVVLYSGGSKEVETLFDEEYQSLSGLQATLGQGDLTYDLVFGLDGVSVRLAQKIAKIRQSISKEKAIGSFFPTLFGAGSRSTAAVITMTQSPKRPLFGEPQSVLVMTIEGGEILTTQRYAPEVLDSLMVGVTKPPEEMTAVLGATAWHFSDGAWSVDGPTAAKELVWFLTKELHTPIDAVLILDERAGKSLTALLSRPSDPNVLGIQDGEGQITKPFMLGGGQEKLHLIDTMQSLLDTKQATLFVKDPQSAETLRALSWDGAVETPTCPAPFAQKKNCVISTRYVTEYQLTKGQGDFALLSQEHAITLGGEEVIHTDTRVYEAPGSGEQDILVKYLVDQDATFTGLSINGERQDLSLYAHSYEFSKNLLAVPIHLQKGKETRVVLSYTSHPVPSNESAFVFFVQKQPGQSEPPIIVKIQYPRNYTAKSVAPRAYSSAQSSTFEEALETSKLFAISF